MLKLSRCLLRAAIGPTSPRLRVSDACRALSSHFKLARAAKVAESVAPGKVIISCCDRLRREGQHRRLGLTKAALNLCRHVPLKAGLGLGLLLAQLEGTAIGSECLHLVVEGQACVLIAADKTVVHRLVGRAFALQAWQGHQLPLLNEKVASGLAGQTDLLKLFAHELTLRVTDALRERPLNVDGQSLRTLHSCFHRGRSCRVVTQ